MARRKDRLEALVADIERAGGTAPAVQADIGRPYPGRSGPRHTAVGELWITPAEQV